MSKIFITGNKPLQGEIEVSGSVNSALRVIIATIFSTEEILISNVPNVEFIQKELQILQELGGEYEWVSKNLLRINNSKLSGSKIPLMLGKDLQTSFLFAGPLLFRFGEAQIPLPQGGIDQIINFVNVWSSLNIEINYDREFIYLRADNSKAGRVELERDSQMLTANAILSAIGVNGKSVIINTSDDYETEDLINFLNQIGAEISKENRKVLNIIGNNHFKSANFSISSEVSEVVFFSVLSLATNGNILINNIEKKNLTIFISILNKIEANYEFVGDSSLRVWKKSENLKAFELDLTNYHSVVNNYLPYIIFLALKCEGTSKILAENYKNKFEFIFLLNKYNAKIKFYTTGKDYDDSEIYINGLGEIKMKSLEITDYTLGPIALMTSLVNEEEVSISNSEKVEVFYENLIQKVVELGGNIKYGR